MKGNKLLFGLSLSTNEMSKRSSTCISKRRIDDELSVVNKHIYTNKSTTD